MHLTQETSRLETRTHAEHRLLAVHARGFVTAEMVHQAAQARPGPIARILVDLREAMGYGAGCATAAQTWLRRAVAEGACQVAFVATSSVMRTAGQLLAAGIDAELQFFEHVTAAAAWLGVPTSALAPTAGDGAPLEEEEDIASEARAS